MKTKHLIERLFGTKTLQGSARREALDKLIKKLAKKRKKLENKLASATESEDRERLTHKLRVNARHQQKANALLQELEGA